MIIVLLDIPSTYSRTRRPDKNHSSCLEMCHSLALSWDAQDLSAVEVKQEPLETLDGQWVLEWMGEISLAPRGASSHLSPAHDCNVYNGTLVLGHSCSASHKLTEYYKISKRTTQCFVCQHHFVLSSKDQSLLGDLRKKRYSKFCFHSKDNWNDWLITMKKNYRVVILGNNIFQAEIYKITKIINNNN